MVPGWLSEIKMSQAPTHTPPRNARVLLNHVVVLSAYQHNTGICLFVGVTIYSLARVFVVSIRNSGLTQDIYKQHPAQSIYSCGFFEKMSDV